MGRKCIRICGSRNTAANDFATQSVKAGKSKAVARAEVCGRNMCEVCENPFRTGWEAAKRNRVPMAVLWTLAAALVFAYYRIPVVAAMLQPVADWQKRWGPLAGMASQALFSGLVPAAFMLAVKSIRPRRALAKAALQCLWSAAWGAVYFWFYALQARMFGAGHEWSTLISKMAFDEFLWTPFVSVPLNGAFYLWMGSDFSFSKAAESSRGRFLRGVALPNLVSSWCVWIPVVLALYSFPGELQVQVLGLVCSFWSLMCLEIGRRCANRAWICPCAS